MRSLAPNHCCLLRQLQSKEIMVTLYQALHGSNNVSFYTVPMGMYLHCVGCSQNG